MLRKGGCTCAMYRGEDVLVSVKKGVAPLVELLQSGGDTAGFSAADKVVGNGAAFLYVLLKVTEVYAEVMSKPALETLKQHGIAASYGTLCDGIVNRAGTGTCPIEEAVSGITDPLEALSAIKKRLETLK